MLQVISSGYLLMICIRVSMVTGQEEPVIVFSSSTETSTDFYKDEPLVLSCQAGNKPTGFNTYGIAFADGDGEPGITGCTITPTRASAVIENPEDVSLINVIGKEGCEAVKADSQWNLQQTIRIESALTSYTMSCQSQDLVTAEITVSQETLKINTADIKVAPSNLTITLPERIIEGEEFSVSCAPGVQGVPQSQYEYVVLPSGEPIVQDMLQGRFTATKDDRAGFSVRCRDTAHPNWRNQADISDTSQTLYPEFIDIGRDAGIDRTIPLNPLYITNTLTCDIIANGANIRYTWTSSVDSEKRANTRVLILDARENIQDGDTESITCEGNVGELKQSITWTITWNMGATTTPPLITTSPPKKSKAGLYGGVGAAAVVPVGICIAMVLVVRHKQIKGTNGGADAATTLHFRSHDSASHEYNLPPVLGEVSIDNSSNVASTSTKTYEQLQIPVSDGVYSQPDEHLYSGLMKRTQIQPTNQRDTTADSSDYVNCANLTPQ